MISIPTSLLAFLALIGSSFFSGISFGEKAMIQKSYILNFPTAVSHKTIETIYQKRFQNIQLKSYQLDWGSDRQLKVTLSSSLSNRAIEQILTQPGKLGFHSLENSDDFLEKAQQNLNPEEKAQTQWLEPLSTLRVKNEKVLQTLAKQLPSGRFTIEKNQDAQLGWTIYLLKPAALTNEHIASFQNVMAENGFNLELAIQFTPQGTSLLADFTTAHQQQTVCLVFDGTALVCPRVMEPILKGKLLMTNKYHTIEDMRTSYYEAFPAFANVDPLPAKPTLMKSGQQTQ